MLEEISYIFNSELTVLLHWAYIVANVQEEEEEEEE